MQPLPIDSLLPEIVGKLKAHKNLILTASPGAGKTTRLPPELLSIMKGQVVILEPRRLAAVGACHRIAEERGWKVGENVGYQVRFENRSTPATRLVFMTDALLLRRMIDDPELKGIDLVVLDEFHERNMNQDLILGALKELQELGHPVKILIMSATLDFTQLQKFLSDAPHVEVEGKVFPLEIRHSQSPLSRQTDRNFYERLTQAVSSAAQETKGDILVFLPGTGEIRRLTERLTNLSREIVPLHGSLSLEEQRKVLSPSPKPRVILATNVAEASVTVPGVDFVIDSGLAKVMTTNLSSGFSSLELSRISLFSARQRAGRAARMKEGICLRLWTAAEERTQNEQTVPEIQRADLSAALLWLAQLGIRDFGQFAWLDFPAGLALTKALQLLRRMKALTDSNELTETGRRLLRFPVPPRLGAILLEAERQGQCRLGARITALLNERDFVNREATTLDECDVTYRLGLLSERHAPVEVLKSAEQLEKLMQGHAGKERDPRELLLLSQIDRLCRRRGKSARGLMVGGRGVRLDESSQVRESEFFLALAGIDLPDQTETLVSMASGFSKAEILATLGDKVKVTQKVEFVESKEEFFATRVRSIDGLPLEEPSLSPVTAAEVQDQLAEILIDKWEWLATKNEALGHWLSRWKYLCSLFPENEIHFREEEIAKTLSLASFGKQSVRAVVEENIVSFLEMTMAPEIFRRLNKEVPSHFLAPSGVAHKIEYLQTAYVDVRLQEIFGLLETPRLVFGKVPITFRLLAPNLRPVQVTADLKNFWAKGYFEVRKELRLRYPKHSWPEDPYTAKPEAKGRRR
jgi:ATP-dependent helicase HrpB